MIDYTATAWCYASEHPITGEILRKSQELQRRFDAKSILPVKKAQDDNIVYMPDDDIAVLGKHRIYGKAYICGNFLEITGMVSHALTGISQEHEPRERTEEELKDSRKKNIYRATYRAQKNIRRIVNTNNFRYMWTFTFAPESDENKNKWECIPLEQQRDYSRVRGLWKVFLKKWKRRYGESFPWLVVFELHDSSATSEEKRETWHIHFATNKALQWIQISVCWGYGVVRYDDFKKPKKGVREKPVNNPGAYMSKYIGKNFTESNFRQKRFSCSRDVLRPVSIDLQTALERYDVRRSFECYRTIQKFDVNGREYTRYSTTIKNPKHIRR